MRAFSISRGVYRFVYTCCIYIYIYMYELFVVLIFDFYVFLGGGGR